MSSDKNVQVTLASRPKGWVEESNFAIVESDIPQPGEGQVLVKNLYLSLDPYMRGRMNDAKSYAAKTEIGDVMVGGTVGEVLESNNSRFKAGDVVVGYQGWQLYGLSNGRDLQIIKPGPVPLSAYLGPVGMPGVTAWYGLFNVGQPKEGETVVVSAASGAVGSVVGQLAKQRGGKAIGIAGGKAKCDYVVEELGFDACVDYKEADFYKNLKAATPDGVDIYFENVGGEIMEAVFSRLNAFARIPLCGTISQYNEVTPYAIRNIGLLLTNRARLEGFIVSEHMEVWPQALSELGQGVAQGTLKYRETITEGIENAPRAFIGLLKGENFGKQLVKLA